MQFFQGKLQQMIFNFWSKKVQIKLIKYSKQNYATNNTKFLKKIKKASSKTTLQILQENCVTNKL